MSSTHPPKKSKFHLPAAHQPPFRPHTPLEIVEPTWPPRQIAISEGFTHLDSLITEESAILFHRQMQKGPHRLDSASTAISDVALHQLTFRLQGDEDQTFVTSEFFPDWPAHITCQQLGDIVLHYYGPQVNKELTIEQSFKSIPFIWDIENREDETLMYTKYASLLVILVRTNRGPFTAAQNLRLSEIIEKRLPPNSQILADYQARRAADKVLRIPETPLHALTRLHQCTEAVRKAVEHLAAYPRTRNLHTFQEGSNASNSVGTFLTIPRAVPVESFIRTTSESRPHFAPLAPLPIALLPTVPRRVDTPAPPPVATPPYSGSLSSSRRLCRHPSRVLLSFLWPLRPSA